MVTAGKHGDRLPRGLLCHDGFFIVEKVVDGVRIKRRLGQVTRKEAERIFLQLTSKAITGRYESEKSASSLKVLDILQKYIDGRLRPRLDAAERDADTVRAKQIKDQMIVAMPVNARLGHIRYINLKRSHIDNYALERMGDHRVIRTNAGDKQGRKIGPTTVKHELRFLSTAINFCIDEGLLRENTIRRFCRVKEADPPKYVLDEGSTGSEWGAVLLNIDSGARLRALILYETGMRPIEVDRMQWEWVKEPVPGYMLIDIPPMAQKCWKARRVPISEPLRNALLATRQAAGPVVGACNIRKAVATAVRRSGLDGQGITRYALRRTRASIWNEIDEGAARFALGHQRKKDAHENNYVSFNNRRLFRLVGMELPKAAEFRVISAAG